MSQPLPRSSHSPPTQPQPSQTTDLESPPVTPVPVVARQNMEHRNIVHSFKEFLLSIHLHTYVAMSQLLPRSSHSPPTQPHSSQTTDLESPPVTPVPFVARQNMKQRNLQWQDLIFGFCFTTALGIALQSTQARSQLPLSFHLLSLSVILTFSTLFVAKLISSKFLVQAQVVEKVAVFFLITAFFHAISIAMPLSLKFFTWATHRFRIPLLLVRSDTVMLLGDSMLLGIVIFLSRKRKISFKSVWRNLLQSIT